MEVKKWGKPVKGEEGVASHGVSWYDSEAMKCGIDVRRERERERELIESGCSKTL